VTELDFAIETDPTVEDVQYLEDRLYEFNSSTTGIDDGQLLAAFVRDDAGKVVAGIAGYTWGGYCEIRQLWVEESLRRTGIGSGLLLAVEEEARRRKCTHILTSTHSFQAPGFYEKHGFRTLYAVSDQPRGYQHLILRKDLA
jgi:GNAT superfamily N-acetyltransferase